MAEFLIKARDAVHADPAVDRRTSYKRGDVVVIKPDGWRWGREEGLPNFVRVKVPGLTVGTVVRFVQGELSALDGGVLTRRLYRVLVDQMPPAVLKTLASTGEATVSWDQARTFVQNKATLAVEG